MIGEITAREDKNNIKKKYDKFIKQVNIIKGLKILKDLWIKLGVKNNYLKNFREVEEIKAFFIITEKEKYDLTLADITDVAKFYKSDFLRR
ncbi:MAG: hypothetical protein QNJ60_02285 [Xenococcaceae cyanobacterium MO_188.B19]|nr:hypothetical protein [Xenococcaceae cyanobacterium MO_188.B19]